MLLSALIYGIYTVAGKSIALRLGSLTMNACSFLFGSLSLIPVLVLRHTPVFTFSLSIWPQLLYITVLVTAAAYYCYFVGLSMLDTSLGAAAFFFKPPLASLLAAAVLGEKLTSGLVFGMILVLTSIWLVKRGAGLGEEKAGTNGMIG